MAAVDGRELTLQDSRYDAATARRVHGRDLTVSELGCYLSHCAAWELAAASTSLTLILESDARLECTLSELTSIVDDLGRYDKPWWLCLLYADDGCNKKSLAAKIPSLRIIKGECSRSHGYVVNPIGARRLLDESLPIKHALDGFTSRMSTKHEGIMLCSTHNLIGWDNNLKSTIQGVPHP